MSDMKLEVLDDEKIFVIHDFLTAGECYAFIAASEQAGYEVATLSTSAGPVVNKEVRDNARRIMHAPELAEEWGQRARQFLPFRVKIWELVGFSAEFKFYRYRPGQQYRIHFDDAVRDDKGRQSLFTFMVYLNDDFAGGATNFHDLQQQLRLRVAPRQGKALVFQQHLQLHEGEAVTSGEKYVLRTDVLYAER